MQFLHSLAICCKLLENKTSCEKSNRENINANILSYGNKQGFICIHQIKNKRIVLPLIINRQLKLYILFFLINYTFWKSTIY